MIRKNAVMLSAIVGLTALNTFSAHAQTPAYDFATAQLFQQGPYTAGFEFTANTSFAVSALGFYDEGGDGLAVSHDVGIWNSSGTLITSATVDSSITDPLIGKFRYKPITPVLLTAGTYTLGGVITADDAERVYSNDPRNSTGFTTDSSITVASDASRFYGPGGNTLSYPTRPGGYTFYAGPNFLIGSAPAAVPEPGSLALLAGIGLTGAGLLVRRRINRSA